MVTLNSTASSVESYKINLLSGATQPKPSQAYHQQEDLLPWADPYIAQLVRKMQREVRAENRLMADVLSLEEANFVNHPTFQTKPNILSRQTPRKVCLSV